jgi:hypothetical protein
MTIWLVLVSMSITYPAVEMWNHIAQVKDMEICQRLIQILNTNRDYPHPDDVYACEEMPGSFP